MGMTAAGSSEGENCSCGMRFAGEVVKNQNSQGTDKYFSHKFLMEDHIL